MFVLQEVLDIARTLLKELEDNRIDVSGEGSDLAGYDAESVSAVEISESTRNQSQTIAAETSVGTLRAFFWYQSKDSIEVFAQRSAENIEQ